MQTARSGTDLLIRFPSLSGESYRVERSPDLSSPAWTVLADNLPGTGGTIQVPDPGALVLSQRFYRVKVWP